MSLIDQLRAEARNSPVSGIEAVANYGRGREGLIPLWSGEGDLATPAFISDAAAKGLRDGETFAVGVGCDKLGKREVVLLRKEIVGASEGVQVVGLNGLEALRRALVNPAVDDHGQLSALLLRRSVEEDFTLPGSIAEVLAALVAKEERVAGAI